MATVEVYTKAKSDEIFDSTVISGEIDAFGHLILTTRDSTEIDTGSLPVPDASLTVKGIVELATNAETIAGTDPDRAVTPAGLAAASTTLVPDASDTVAGRVELATSTETITGSDATRAVTPAGLAAKVASDTAAGIVELATSTETITGSDATRAVTPAGLAAKVASDTASGIVELATNAEAITGTDATRAVTPAALAAVLARVQENVQNTSGTTTSTSYTQTLTSGTTCELTFVANALGQALIHWSGYLTNSTSTSITYMGFEVRLTDSAGAVLSGFGADDSRAVAMRGNSAGSDDQDAGKTRLITGMTPGATYYVRLMFRVTANTGTYVNKSLIIDAR